MNKCDYTSRIKSTLKVEHFIAVPCFYNYIFLKSLAELDAKNWNTRGPG